MDAHQISRSKTLMRMGHKPDDTDEEKKTIKSFSTRDLGEQQEVLDPQGDRESKAVKDLGDLMDRRFSPSSSIGSGARETLLSPTGSSQPVPVAPDSGKSKGGMFMRRSNTLREYIRSPSFLSKGSSGSAGTEDAGKSKDKDRKYAPPIVTRGLDAFGRNPGGQDMGRSASDPSFVRPPEIGPRTAPVDGYRGQLQHGGGALTGGAASDGRLSAMDSTKKLSPLRPKRPDGRYNTSAEVHTRGEQDVPPPIQRSLSAVPSLTDTREPSASFRSAPVSMHDGTDRGLTPHKDDASVYSHATGVTGKYPNGAVGPAFVFEEEETKKSVGKSKSRAEVRMTELYEGYYASADSKDDDEDGGSIPIPPVPVISNRSYKDDYKRPTQGQSDRPNPTVLMHSLENLRIQQREKPDTRLSPASSQDSPIVTIPVFSPYDHGGHSLTKKPTLLTPASGSGNDFRRQPTFRRSPLNSSSFEDGELIDVDMQSIRVKVSETNHVSRVRVLGVLTSLSTLRLQIRYNDDIRAVVISSQIDLREFRTLLCDKFEIPDRFKLRFRDEEGDQVSLKDDGDWDAALDCARVVAAGRPEGRLDVWLL